MEVTLDDTRDEVIEALKAAGVQTGTTISHQTLVTLFPDAQAHDAANDGVTVEELPPEAKPDTSQAEPDLKVVSVLGEGGMGVVHAADQRSLGRTVAVKMPHSGATQAAGASLVREARFTGMLEHPNIPPVHALCRSDDQPMLVMKLIKGVVWSELLSDDEHEAWRTTKHFGDPPLVRHVELLISVCDALHYAHSHGIVHRDLKPDNVMVGAFGEVYLLDWGIAARADELAEMEPPRPFVGTPAYMAPEMLGGLADTRTDVYLAGAVLHEVLSGGNKLHRGEDLFDVIYDIKKPTPFEYDEDVPEQLVQICRRATRVEPGERYADVVAFREALGGWLRSRGVEQLVAASWERLESARADGEDKRRVLAECRFGFSQALVDLPGNQDAQRGLGECLLELVDLELGQGNVQAADSLLDELAEDLPADLEDRVEAVRTEQAHQLKLRDEAQDMDARLSRRERTIFFVSLVLLSVPMWLFTFTRDRSGESGVVALRTVGYPVVSFAILTLAAVVFWRRLAKNRLGRQWVITTLAIIFAWAMSRLLAWHHGLYIWTAISFDLVIMGLGVAVLSVWTARWVLPGLAGMVAGLALVTWRSELYLKAFLLAFLIVLAWLALGWKRGWGGTRSPPKQSLRDD